MVRAKNNSAGHIPDGQNASGTGQAVARNPKNDQSRRPDITSVTPDGDMGMAQSGKFGTSDTFPGRNAPNQAQKGTAATEPDPATINRGYSQITPENVPTIRTNTSANRDNFGFDPGPLTLDSNGTPNVDRPVLPNYGTGSTGD